MVFELSPNATLSTRYAGDNNIGSQPKDKLNEKVFILQGVVKSYDPATRDGVVITDTASMDEYEFAPDAMENSGFRMLRPGQRINFDLDLNSRAIALRFGSESDMTTPPWEGSQD